LDGLPCEAGRLAAAGWRAASPLPAALPPARLPPDPLLHCRRVCTFRRFLDRLTPIFATDTHT
jgi:hypothetical protein